MKEKRIHPPNEITTHCITVNRHHRISTKSTTINTAQTPNTNNPNNWGKNSTKENIPSEHLFLMRVDAVRLLGSNCLPAAVEVEGRVMAEPLFLEVDGEDFSKGLSNASLIRFRSSISPALDEPPPPRSLYILQNR